MVRWRAGVHNKSCMPHHKAHGTSSPEHYDCTRFVFGDRWQFAVECEVQDCDLDPWGSREPFGSFWLWAGGQIVGNTEVAEQLIHAFAPLYLVGNTSGERKASGVPGASCLDKLDFIGWLRFGEDADFDPGRWGGRDILQLRQLDLTRFEVMPRAYSPFHDGWEAVVLEDREHEVFIWRRWSGDVDETYDLSLPLGDFSRVVAQAVDWFRSFRRSRIGSEDTVSSDRPAYVERSDDPRFAGI